MQEQPLLLEDLLEQEKREQARNINTNQMDAGNNIQSQQSLFSEQVNLISFFTIRKLKLKLLGL